MEEVMIGYMKSNLNCHGIQVRENETSCQQVFFFFLFFKMKLCIKTLKKI